MINPFLLKFCLYVTVNNCLADSIFLSTSISISVILQPHLLLSGSATTLGELAVVVHGRGSAARGFAALPSFRVQHPPGAFPCALILDTHKAAVQRQIVTNRVLKKCCDNVTSGKRCPGNCYVDPQISRLAVCLV